MDTKNKLTASSGRMTRLVRHLGDFDVWYLPCERCGYDAAKSSKADVKYCWKCGNRVYRDFTDRALKSLPNV
jgi:hypothetical protein